MINAYLYDPDSSSSLELFVREFSTSFVNWDITVCQTFEAIDNTNIDILVFDINQLGNTHFQSFIQAPNRKIEIICIGTKKEQAYEAFKIKAFDFLLQPFQKERLSFTFKTLQEKITNKKEKRQVSNGQKINSRFSYL